MIKTITLSGGEVAVALDGAHAHIRNDGTDIIYAAKTAGITAGADGVASIPAGQADTVRGISGVVYLLGTGAAHIQSDDYVASPFKTSAQAGGSGADEVARAAINAHAGNTEVHVTAEEKSAWSAKAELSDIPTSLPANGGDATTAREITSPNSKAKLWEDNEGGNLRLVSPDGNHSVEMDLYNNIGFRMYFTDNGELTFPVNYDSNTKKFNINGDADTVDGFHSKDLAYLTNVIGGLRRGWATANIGVIMTYADREVVKTSNDLSYFGWTINSDGWFTPIIVSQSVSGTNTTIFNSPSGYDKVVDSDKATFSYKNRTYYACWANPSSMQNPTVAGGLYLTVTNNDYVTACKTLIDMCECIDSDTVDGKHASDFYQIATGLRTGTTSQFDIFSTTLSSDHPCWNKWCYVAGNSIDASASDYINNAPETLGSLWYEVFTGGNYNRAFQVAIGCFSWQNKTFIRYQHDGNWSDWKNIADGGNAASVGAYTEAKLSELESRIAALESK